MGKIRYAKNLITGAIETQSGGVEGEQAFLDTMRSNMIGDGASGITPEDVEVGWMEMDTLVALQAAHEVSLETYADKRRKEYPEIVDQLDYIYHNGLEKWREDMILPIKERHPKP